VYDALIEDRCAAAMLNLPWSALAARAGCPVLADHRAVAPRLQTSCAASLAPWLAAHPNEADAYLRSMVAALAWLYDPSRRDDATALLARSLEVAVEDAALVFNKLCDPLTGWPPSAFIDPEGIRAVCALRAEALAKVREAPEAYFTFEVYRRVLGF
jgi:ABC-type nitrate/sulfonate/bicarbonate transport system substrate-binding protein